MAAVRRSGMANPERHQLDFAHRVTRPLSLIEHAHYYGSKVYNHYSPERYQRRSSKFETAMDISGHGKLPIPFVMSA